MDFHSGNEDVHFNKGCREFRLKLSFTYYIGKETNSILSLSSTLTLCWQQCTFVQSFWKQIGNIYHET